MIDGWLLLLLLLLLLKESVEVLAAWRFVLSKSIVAAEVHLETWWRVRSIPHGCCCWETCRRLRTSWRVMISRPLMIMVYR